MSNNVTSSSSSGIGFLGLLTVLFVGLKLTGVIAWSWVWVLSPLWLGFAVVLGVMGIIGLGFVAFLIYREVKEKFNGRKNKEV